jgi:hypothetical protein
MCITAKYPLHRRFKRENAHMWGETAWDKKQKVWRSESAVLLVLCLLKAKQVIEYIF